MRAWALAAGVLALAGGAARAQGALLDAAEARRALFGVEISGVYEGDGERFRECIDPQGRTAYHIYGTVDQGRLTIASDGRACFSYASSGYSRQSCFTVHREGSGFRFRSGPDSPDFVADRVRRGVSACAGSDAPIS